MTLLGHILDEADGANTLFLGVALVLMLAATRAFGPSTERRDGGIVLLFVGHLALVPVAGWLGYAHAGQSMAGSWAQAGDGVASPTHGAVRMVLLIFAAMTGIRIAGHLVFDVVLPRVRLPAPRILRDLVTAAAFIVAVLAVASRMGFNLSGIIATSAVVTAVIGFSLQDTLGNVMGGLALQLDNSIGVGDWVKVGDVSGRVTEIRWRHTAVETRNWETVIFPNSMLMKGQVTVMGRRTGQPALWRRWVYFTTDSVHSPALIMRAVAEGLNNAAIERVSPVPPPQCILIDFNDAGCKYAVRYWLTDIGADDPTDSAVRTIVFTVLRRIGIPLSHSTSSLFVRGVSHGPTDEEREAERAKLVGGLREVEVFRDMSQEERTIIAQGLKYAPYSKGETMTKQGNVAHWLYIIMSGDVSVRVAVAGGMEREVSKLQGPIFVGEMGLLTGEPRAATIVASTDIECYRLDKVAFQNVLQIRPLLAVTVAELLTRRRVELDAVREGLSAEAKEKRVQESSAQVLAKIREFFGI